jgi:hypothetical protein
LGPWELQKRKINRQRKDLQNDENQENSEPPKKGNEIAHRQK